MQGTPPTLRPWSHDWELRESTIPSGLHRPLCRWGPRLRCYARRLSRPPPTSVEPSLRSYGRPRSHAPPPIQAR
jgi:hypothetical protein